VTYCPRYIDVGDRLRVPVNSGSVGSQLQLTVTELAASLAVAEVVAPDDPVVAGGLPLRVPMATVAPEARRGTRHIGLVVLSAQQKVPLCEAKATVGEPLLTAGSEMATVVPAEAVAPVSVAETVDEYAWVGARLAGTGVAETDTTPAAAAAPGPSVNRIAVASSHPHPATANACVHATRRGPVERVRNISLPPPVSLAICTPRGPTLAVRAASASGIQLDRN
jgi:hypothetical protein